MYQSRREFRYANFFRAFLFLAAIVSREALTLATYASFKVTRWALLTSFAERWIPSTNGRTEAMRIGQKGEGEVRNFAAQRTLNNESSTFYFLLCITRNVCVHAYVYNVQNLCSMYRYTLIVRVCTTCESRFLLWNSRGLPDPNSRACFCVRR